ncbi:MAG: transposase [Gammaproteobacteria bacterium]|nr:transposase [Gammaproteobacteria bacterium]
MARLPRNVVPGFPVHVIQRGNNRQAVFFSGSDYRLYLDSLRLAAERAGCAVHAYVLMTNHVHLLVTPGAAASLSQLMQSVGRRYVRYVNGIYKRTGTLWEGRFKSAVVDSDRYLLTCMRYIEMNPVRAGMVGTPEAFRWSSYGRNALGRADGIITPHRLYEALGDSLSARNAAYRGLFHASAEIEDLATIRSGTETGAPIGNDRFRAEIAAMLSRRVERFSHGGDRRGKRFKKVSSTLTP